MICEIINIVHSRGMFFFVFVFIYCIICLSSMESNKKLLKNKKICVTNQCGIMKDSIYSYRFRYPCDVIYSIIHRKNQCLTYLLPNWVCTSRHSIGETFASSTPWRPKRSPIIRSRISPSRTAARTRRRRTVLPWPSTSRYSIHRPWPSMSWSLPHPRPELQPLWIDSPRWQVLERRAPCYDNNSIARRLIERWWCVSLSWCALTEELIILLMFPSHASHPRCMAGIHFCVYWRQFECVVHSWARQNGQDLFWGTNVIFCIHSMKKFSPFKSSQVMCVSAKSQLR